MLIRSTQNIRGPKMLKGCCLFLILNKIFVSKNLDLIEHELYEWTDARYRVRWASSSEGYFPIGTNIEWFSIFCVISVLFRNSIWVLGPVICMLSDCVKFQLIYIKKAYNLFSQKLQMYYSGKRKISNNDGIKTMAWVSVNSYRCTSA